MMVSGPLEAAANESGAALKKAFKRKVQDAAPDQGSAFLPMAMETPGGFHKVALEQAKRIGAAVAGHQGIEDLVATKQLFQRLSVTWMPGNAALLMTRRPDRNLILPKSMA